MSPKSPKIVLPQKWEDGLRKGVYTVGTFVEKMIGKAEGFGAGLKQTSSSAQPILSLEGQLTVPKLKEVINITVDRIVSSHIPSLVDKTAVEIREGSASLVPLFRERGASVSIGVDMGLGAGSYGPPKSGITSIRAGSTRLPFEDGFFDYVVANMASQFQGDIFKGLKEFSRVLAQNGEGVVVDFHPFGLYAKRGSVRLRPIESTIRGVEDYFRLCKVSALKVTSVREAFFDELVRQFFTTDAEKQALRIVKDSPFLIFVYVKKGS